MSLNTKLISIMRNGKYYIFEITQSGTLQKVSLLSFNSKEQAEDEIKRMWFPMNRMKLIAVKVFD